MQPDTPSPQVEVTTEFDEYHGKTVSRISKVFAPRVKTKSMIAKINSIFQNGEQS